MNWFEIIASLLFWPVAISIAIIGSWRTDSIRYAEENAKLKKRIEELSQVICEKTDKEYKAMVADKVRNDAA